jgi:hypothetical protein
MSLYWKLKQLVKTIFNPIVDICRWPGDNYCRIKLRTNPRDWSFMNFEQQEQRITHIRLNLGFGFSWIWPTHALLVNAPAVNILFWCARRALLYYCTAPDVGDVRTPARPRTCKDTWYTLQKFLSRGMRDIDCIRNSCMNSCHCSICCSRHDSLFKKSRLNSNGWALAENERSRSGYELPPHCWSVCRSVGFVSIARLLCRSYFILL